jgi:hypothetical protein
MQISVNLADVLRAGRKVSPQFIDLAPSNLSGLDFCIICVFRCCLLPRNILCIYYSELNLSPLWIA